MEPNLWFLQIETENHHQPTYHTEYIVLNSCIYGMAWEAFRVTFDSQHDYVQVAW